MIYHDLPGENCDFQYIYLELPEGHNFLRLELLFLWFSSLVGHHPLKKMLLMSCFGKVERYPNASHAGSMVLEY